MYSNWVDKISTHLEPLSDNLCGTDYHHQESGKKKGITGVVRKGLSRWKKFKNMDRGKKREFQEQGSE